MRTIRSVQAMASWRESLYRDGVIVGLVPTMGALHEGHRALIRAARLSCDAVAVSIFVNPRQFAPREDFSRYPRPFLADAALCRGEGVDVLFAPPRDAVYPPGFDTSVSVGNLARRWEGEHRPSHFDGVATIVTKLIGLVRPHKAFFGQKDFQQTVLVRRLVADLHLGAAVVMEPTVREAGGLAMSSRNAYLTAAQRRVAPILYRALQAGQAAVRRGMRSGAAIQRVMLHKLVEEPSALVEYVAACDPDTLEPLRQVAGKAVLLGAIRIGRIRLIDNLLVNALA